VRTTRKQVELGCRSCWAVPRAAWDLRPAPGVRDGAEVPVLPNCCWP